MKLVIHAHALKKEPLSQALTGQFDERGGTIGRSDTNTLTLPDPERHVSRLQAEVIFAGSAFSIRNVGSANPIELNGRSLRPGEGAPLSAGDQLVIGGYALKVVAATSGVDGPATPAPRVDARTVIRASAAEARTDPPPRSPQRPTIPPHPRTAPSPTPAVAADPFADLMGGAGPASQTDPFGDLLAAAAPAPAPATAATPAMRRAKSNPVSDMITDAPVTPARLPDDFDPFADVPSSSSNTAASGLEAFVSSPMSVPAAPLSDSMAPDSTLGDLLGIGSPGGPSGSPASSIDAAFGLGGPTGHKSSASLLDEFLAPQRPAGATPSGDVLDLFGGHAAAAAAPTEPAAFNRTPELHSAYSPPAVNPAIGKAAWPARQSRPMPFDVPAQRPGWPGGDDAPAATPAPPSRRRPDASPRAASNPAADAGSTSPEALWQAFCQGAGVNVALPQGLNPEMMRLMGQLMHRAVEGTLRLMSMRAAAKQELRAQVTTIQSKNNNPLKFSVDPQAALAQLLQPPMRGFMPGPDAVRDAMDDLLGHNIGTMAGTRAALQGMLKRFEPARLEAKLSNKGVIDAVLPMNRRAKLWELYVEHYQQVQSDATEDFHELFGKAFVKAYEHQLDLLEASRNKDR